MKRLFNPLLTVFNDKFGFPVIEIFRAMTTLETLRFDNLALKLLPLDTEETNYVRTVRGACFSKVKPTPLQNPKIVAVSSYAMELIDLSNNELEREDLVEYFSGNKLLPGSEPAAHCYCGHQFGNFSGQLGDGAVIYLGEIINNKNERWEIQLKGAGLTPYSRTADGRKVLRSSIREFLCSEAMHFLGISTSRAGTCITSDDEVFRDKFYDGCGKNEKCAVVSRIAPTFIRFGSFEITKTLDPITRNFGPSVGRDDISKTLLNYVINTFYPEISASDKSLENKYISFFKEIVLRTARLVALWQCIGFCHGVLNTDNMSILGFTLDYGPYGFLDMYNPYHICNASDLNGRYSYIKQPEVCLWNLKKLAESLQKILPLDKSLSMLKHYTTEFQSTYLKKMQNKLGLLSSKESEDRLLIQELMNTMENTGADFTNTFLCFSFINAEDLETTIKIAKDKLLEQCYSLQTMIDTYCNEMQLQRINAVLSAASSNPSLLTAVEHYSVQKILFLLEKSKILLRMTEEEKRSNDEKLWLSWLEQYQKRIKKDIEGYNGSISDYNTNRLKIMKKSNPRFILRNYILQEAIEKAENGDYSQVRKLLKIIENPYEDIHNSAFNNIPLFSKAGGKESAEENVESPCIIYHKAPPESLRIKVS